jgi:hypothetical protein
MPEKNNNNGGWWKLAISSVSLALLVYLITAIVCMDRITAKVEAHELRIGAIEENLSRQPLRDYILIELAKKNGIPIPRELE